MSKKTTQALAKVLADTYTLYLKTQFCHWNVEGPHFHSLHELFESQYTEYAEAIDTLAERIRALGEYAPGGFKAFSGLTSLNEFKGIPKANAMVRELAGDQAKIRKTIEAAIDAATKQDDKATEDFLIERLQAHDKNAWMLNSLLKK